MSINVLAFLLIFLAIIARVLLSHLLLSQKKALEGLITESRRRGTPHGPRQGLKPPGRAGADRLIPFRVKSP